MEKYKGQNTVSPGRSNANINENIYLSVKPLLRVSQIFGMAPVTWPDLRISPWGIIYTSTLFIAIASWFVYTIILDSINEFPGQPATSIIPNLFNSSVLYLTSLSALVFSILATGKKFDIIIQLVLQVVLIGIL